MLAIYHILAKSRLCWVHRDEDHENSDERHCEYSDVEMNDAKPLENFERRRSTQSVRVKRESAETEVPTD